MTNLTRRALTLFACIVLAASWSELPAAETSNIIGVQVSPDARQIMIKGDGPLGKHSAFVINQPYRLVVDFDHAGLGPVPAKTKINKDLINEIRLGRVNSRSRVVADFGENPVPAFKIHLQGNLVVIALGDSPTAAARSGAAPPTSHAVPKASHKPGTSPRRPSAKASPPTEKQSGMLIKTSGTKDSLVFVELADRRDPTRTYRLAIDCDLAARRVRHATLSDHSGAVRRFDLAEVDASPDGKKEKNQPMVGPRRDAMSQGGATTRRTKYQWGLPNVDSKESHDQQVSLKSPFQVDDTIALSRVSSR